MIPVSLTIRNIASHRDTHVDFEKLGPLAALQAANGTGKTTLLSAMFCAIYGDLPDYPGGIYDAMTHGASEAEIVFTFDLADGRRFNVCRRVRVTDKTRAQSVTVHEGHVAVAGPKVTQAEEFLAALLGEKEAALATWFSSQNRSGDLTTVAQSARRDLFARWLEFGKLQAVADKAKERAKKLDARAELLATQAGTERPKSEDVNRANLELRAFTERLPRYVAARDQKAAIINALQQEEANVDRDDSALHAVIKQYENEGLRAGSIRSRVEKLQAELTHYEAQAAKLPAAEAWHAQAIGLERAVATLEEQDAAFRAYQAWAQEYQRIVAERVALIQQIGLLESRPGLDAETVALAAELPGIKEQYRAAEAANKKAEVALEAERRAVEALQREDARLADEGNRLRARLAGKPTTPGAPEVCATCVLLQEFAAIPARLKQIEEERTSIAAQLANRPVVETTTDLRELIERGARARAAAEAVKAAEADATKLAALRWELDAVEGALGNHNSNRPAKVDDPRAELAARREELRTAQIHSRDLSLFRAASDRLPALRDSLAEATGELDAAVARCNELKPAVEEARKSLLSRADARRDIVARLQSARMEHENLVGEIDKINAAIGATRERLAGYREAERRADTKAAESASLRLRVANLRTLATAYGPKGGQALLIDAQVPRLESIAQALLSELTEGRQAIRFATQELNADGSVRECLSILIRDAQGERDVLALSGGERRIVQTALRLAVAEWLGQLHGTRPGFLVLDEALDALDEENTARLLALLTGLRNRYRQILIVTHSEDVAARLPSAVYLRKFGHAGVAVNYYGEAKEIAG